MKIAIMQPYFFPYIGYFQLINAVDEFVIYDNIEYTKKGWINRNRILENNKDVFITLPLKKDSDYLFVRDRYLADSWRKDKKKLLNKITENYKKAKFFNNIIGLFENCINFESENLFDFIYKSLITINEYLEIKTKITISSTIEINHNLKSVNKVIEICKVKKAHTYINPIGGLELYSKENFLNNKINLFFLKTISCEYKQFENQFIPFLSILDVMMFNTKEEIKEMLNQYELI